jgi:hypothetical protein
MEKKKTKKKRKTEENRRRKKNIFFNVGETIKFVIQQIKFIQVELNYNILIVNFLLHYIHTIKKKWVC